MPQIDLRICLWNSNGLVSRLNELELFVKMNNIDIMLITETHGTDRTYVKIPGFSTILANHPHNKAYGGSAIIIKNALNHTSYQAVVTDAYQIAIVEIPFMASNLKIGSVYCRPRFNLKEADYDNIISIFDDMFIVGGDFNAKHTMWGSRLCTPKGGQMLRSINKNSVSYYSGGAPTYWPTDPAKIPDLLDFFITKGISQRSISVANLLDLSSDHSPVLMTCCGAIRPRQPPKRINYNKFRDEIGNKINVKIKLKTPQDIDREIETFASIMKQTIEECSNSVNTIKGSSLISNEIREKVAIKRRLRARWQRTRDPVTKQLLNRTIKELKADLQTIKEDELTQKLQNLTPNSDTDYSLWKELKQVARPIVRKDPLRADNGDWIKDDKQKAQEFRKHFENQFTPNAISKTQMDKIKEALDQPLPPIENIKFITKKEIVCQIKKLNVRKAPGPDGITSKTIKFLPPNGIALLTIIFNAILRLGHFPQSLKSARVITILKPGKPTSQVSSYRPISILSSFSKLIERLILARMREHIEGAIPIHQFGFRQGHGTVEQCHRIVDFIRKAMEEKKYCPGVFLDVEKAFDKVWHHGLMFKIRNLFQPYIYLCLKSFLTNRDFFVQVGLEQSDKGVIRAGVPQGSVLGPHLYVLYTADMPEIGEEGMNATFADDTAFLFADKNELLANEALQNQLFKIEEWSANWGIKINSLKSAHCTFTLNKNNTQQILTFNNNNITQTNEVKYLGLYIDSRLTFKKHIETKRKELDIARRKYYYILNSKSKLSLYNKLIIYKCIIKPKWLYCLVLWGLASKSNIKKIQSHQNITLRVITGAPKYMRNDDLHKELKMTTVEEEIDIYKNKHKNRIEYHPNEEVRMLADRNINISRLKKKMLTFAE